jgi:hypothetical protein
MRALCIDATPGRTTNDKPNFREGEIVNVWQSAKYPNCYNVREHLFNADGILKAWEKNRFVPTSNIDENAALLRGVQTAFKSN